MPEAAAEINVFSILKLYAVSSAGEAALTISSRWEEVEGALCEVIALRPGRATAVITEGP